MCFATLATIGSVVSAAGTVASGFATAANANYQSQVAANNAQIAQQNAAYAIEAGQAKTEQQALKNASAGGAIRAQPKERGTYGGRKSGSTKIPRRAQFRLVRKFQ